MAIHGKNEAARIVIVGGGVSGLSIAIRLAQSGLAVVVLEAGRLGQGVSTKNQGWLYSGAWFAPTQVELARLCHESLKQTLHFCPDCLESDTASMIYLISSPKTGAAHWTKAWDAAGIPYENVSPSLAAEELRIAEPLVQHAFRLPDRAFRSDALLTCLTAKAEHLGVEVRTESPVTEFVRSGNRIDGVVTSQGEELPARLVILAANAGGVSLWPRGLKGPQQSEYSRIGLKTHCLAIHPNFVNVPFCVVDVEGFNHVPHRLTSVFGFNRWVPVMDVTDEHVIAPEIERLWKLVSRFYPELGREGCDVVEWAGVTVQAMHFDQTEPALVPMPTVIDNERELPRASNLLTVFPGRASLWPQLAEMTRKVVLEKLHGKRAEAAQPPWATESGP